MQPVIPMRIARILTKVGSMSLADVGVGIAFLVSHARFDGGMDLPLGMSPWQDRWPRQRD
jgi:hypothetical protein